MKAFLMFRGRDFDLQSKSPPNEQALTQDLELGVLLSAMSRDDKFLLEVSKKAVMSFLVDLEAILYRQDVLKDCLKNTTVARDIYNIAVEAITEERKIWGWYDRGDSPDRVTSRAVNALRLLAGKLKELREVADRHSGSFESEGFRTFFTMLKQELSDDYLASIQAHLTELEFRRGTLISAKLQKGNKGANYTLRKQRGKKQGWISRVFLRDQARQYSFTLDERDENGPRYLGELREQGINAIANALAQSGDNVLSFFKSLRTELAFYLACMNLQEQLTQKGEPTCFPVPLGVGKHSQSVSGLYDACLSLKLGQRVVGNDVDAKDKDLVIITGANRGGKSTFLRSVGVAQLMMQCGAFVPAESFSSDVCVGLFTHFKRQEDPTMKSGKLDEELSRMSETVNHLTPNCTVLFNESFSSTNEREGSEVARQVVSALLKRQIKVVFVTHQYEVARGFYDKKMPNALFLRAERKADGERTFKVIEGEPLQTSFGKDIYNRIFFNTPLSAPSVMPASS